MSTENDVARSLRSWLREERHEDADRVLDAVFDQVSATPQRSASWLARRFPPMNSNMIRIAVAAVVVVVAAFVGFQLMAGPNVGDQSPSPSASSAPSTLQSAGPAALPPIPDQPLSAGTYSLDDGFPVVITFEVPEGWVSCSSSSADQGVCKPSTDTEPGSGVGFVIVDNVVADPCGPGNELLDPPVGPSVDDLVAALSSLEGFEATAPVDLTVDGFSGKEFTLTAPAIEGCETWRTESGTNGVGPGERNLLRILDVDGVRVVINGAYQPETSEEQLAAIEQVIESVHIEP